MLGAVISSSVSIYKNCSVQSVASLIERILAEATPQLLFCVLVSEFYFLRMLQCIEEAGIKPKRLAGTSAGAITAGLLAVGYTSEEIHILYEYDVEYNVKG